MKIRTLFFTLSFAFSFVADLNAQIDSIHQPKIDSFKLKIYAHQEKKQLIDWMYAWLDLGRFYRQKEGNRRKTIACTDSILVNIWRAPQTRKEEEEWMWLFQGRGYNFKRLGHYADAKAAYEIAYAKSVELNIENDEVGTYIFRELGNIYTRFGDYEQAIKLHSLFLKTANNSNNKADAHADLASAYRWKKNFIKSIAEYQKGLQIEGISEPTRGLLLNGLADVQNEQGDLDNCLKTLELAQIALKDITSSVAKLRLINTYILKGKVFSKLQEKQAAVAAFNQALFFANQSYKTQKRREFAKIYIQKGEHFLRTKETDKALVAFQKALQAVVPNFAKNNPEEHPDASSFYAENSIWEALVGKATAFEQQYQKTKEDTALKNALTCLELTNRVEDLMRQDYWNQSASLGLLEERRKDREKAIGLAYKLYTQTLNKEFVEMAFQLAEKSKSMLLLENIRGIAASNQLNLPDSLLAKERQIQENLLICREDLKKVKSKIDSLQIVLLEKEERILEVRYQQFKAYLQEAYPNYFALKHDTKTIAIAEVQQQLIDDKTLFLEYFIAEEVVYVFAIQKDKADFYQLKKAENFQENIAFLVRSIGQFKEDFEAFQLFSKKAFKVFQQLIEPIKNYRKFEKLVIVPDEILHYLPFEVLLTQATNFSEVRYDELPYFVFDHAINYGYSATLLVESQKRELANKASMFLGFSPTFGSVKQSDYGADLENLPYNQQLVKELKLLLQGKAFTGQNATVSELKSRIGESMILHLGTHAKMDDENPLNSRIFFADTSIATAEIYNMPLESQLVVLSACETGIGKLYKGEGVMSLARGFMHAGSPSIVTSLWKVDDKSTAELMRVFYERLQKGTAKDVALHQGKMAFLKQANERLAHPYFWAAFVHIGNPQPIFEKSKFYWWIGGGLLLLIIGFYWLYRRKFQ